MKVFTFYDSSSAAHPDQAEFIRLWALSWERRGFTPRLLTARHAQRSKFYAELIEILPSGLPPACLPWLALHAIRGSGWLTSPHIINFSLCPARRSKKLPGQGVDYFSPDVSRASRAGVVKFVESFSPHYAGGCQVTNVQFPAGQLVRFERAADVLTCGREL